MKICIDCRMLKMSGIGTFLRNVLENLPQNNEYILLGKQEDLFPEYNKYSIYNCTIPVFSIKELFFFPSSIVNKHSDAFFSPNWNIPLGIKVPVFSVIHDVALFDVTGLVKKTGKIVRYLLMNRTILISNTIFTVSNFSRDRIRYYYPSANPFVIYNDVSKKIKLYIPLRKEKTEDYFLYVGNVKPHKGLSILIDAFRKLNTDLKLYIIGERKNFKTNKVFIDNNFTNIIFTGYVDDNTLYNYIYNAKALIQPSIYEGFGIPPAEALWLNTPVILSDIPVFKEIYGNFPVTFFRTGDVDDLVIKISTIKKNKNLNKEFFEVYNAKKQTLILFQKIKEGTDEKNPSIV